MTMRKSILQLVLSCSVLAILFLETVSSTALLWDSLENISDSSREKLPTLSPMKSLGNMVCGASTFADEKCLHNITLDVGILDVASVQLLQDAFCRAAGGQCEKIEFVESTQRVVSVEDPPTAPGAFEPIITQKILLIHRYNLTATNRTVALTNILNSVRYASPLREYNIYSLEVGEVATLYQRPELILLTYRGNTSQCVSHYWYFIFFIIIVPIFGSSYHYFRYRLKRDNEKKLRELGYSGNPYNRLNLGDPSIALPVHKSQARENYQMQTSFSGQAPPPGIPGSYTEGQHTSAPRFSPQS